MQAQTQSQIDSMGIQQSWHRPTETLTYTGSCSNPLKSMHSALTAACKGRERRRRSRGRRRRRRTAEGEEEEKEEAYVSSVIGAMFCPANRQTWVWVMSWWCDSTGCTYRLGSQLWLMKRATLPSCFASRMYFACLWVSLTGKCNTHLINHLIHVFF